MCTCSELTSLCLKFASKGKADNLQKLNHSRINDSTPVSMHASCQQFEWCKCHAWTTVDRSLLKTFTWRLPSFKLASCRYNMLEKKNNSYILFSAAGKEYTCYMHLHAQIKFQHCKHAIGLHATTRTTSGQRAAHKTKIPALRHVFVKIQTTRYTSFYMCFQGPEAQPQPSELKHCDKKIMLAWMQVPLC